MPETGGREECPDPAKTCDHQEFPPALHEGRLLLLQVSIKREQRSAGKSTGNREVVKGVAEQVLKFEMQPNSSLCWCFTRRGVF